MKKNKVKESHPQIPLSFKNKSPQTFENFTVGANTSVIDNLNSFIESNESLFYLWGDSGSGKSHLLNALVDSNGVNKQLTVVINPAELTKRENVSLIVMFQVVCIDNIEHIASNKLLEESLFFWINEIKQAHKKVIVSGQLSNVSDQWHLPDLRSRLVSGRTQQLVNLERDNVLSVFNQLANQKGLVIEDRVLSYLKKNAPMNLNFLSDLLAKIDERTLVEKKQVTIPLIKSLL